MTASTGLRPPPPADAGESRLVLSPDFRTESVDGDGAVIYLHSKGTRIKVPLALHKLLGAFSQAAAPAEVARSRGGERALAAIRGLAGKGFLIAEGVGWQAAPRATVDPGIRFLDAPAWSRQKEAPDVVLLGMPYDLADRAAAGARAGPAAFREISLQTLYGLDRLSGRPSGWFDADSRAPLLKGVTFADAGDAAMVYGEPRETFFARASAVLSDDLASASFPVVIGGDASVSRALTDALLAGAGQTEPLALFRFGDGGAAGRRLARRLVKREEICAVYEIAPAPRSEVPAEDSLRCTDLGALAALPAPFHYGAEGGIQISIDAGALGPAGEGAGFDYPSLKAALTALAGGGRLRGIDICGLNPSVPGFGVRAMTALHLLLVTLDSHGSTADVRTE